MRTITKCCTIYSGWPMFMSSPFDGCVNWGAEMFSDVHNNSSLKDCELGQSFIPQSNPVYQCGPLTKQWRMDPENAKGESAIGSKKPSTQSNKNHQECWNSLQRTAKWAIVDLWTKMLWESLEGHSQTDQEWAAWTHVPPTKECLGCVYHVYEPDWVYPRPPWYVGPAMRRDQEYTSW